MLGYNLKHSGSCTFACNASQTHVIRIRGVGEGLQALSPQVSRAGVDVYFQSHDTPWFLFLTLLRILYDII